MATKGIAPKCPIIAGIGAVNAEGTRNHCGYQSEDGVASVRDCRDWPRLFSHPHERIPMNTDKLSPGDTVQVDYSGKWVTVYVTASSDRGFHFETMSGATGFCSSLWTDTWRRR